MKGVQCYELFGGIALKITHFHFIAFSFQIKKGNKKMFILNIIYTCTVMRKKFNYIYMHVLLVYKFQIEMRDSVNYIE